MFSHSKLPEFHFHGTKNQRALTSWNSFYITSAVAEHAIKTGHTIDWNGAKVIDGNDHFYQRCLLESWHIQSNKNALNREIGTLPRVYQSLMQELVIA